jgi:hypothetical protein
MSQRPCKGRGALALVVAVGVLLATATGAGCIDAFQPDVGAPLSARCANVDSNPDVDVSYARDVAPVFEDLCDSCHMPDGRSPTGIQVGGLDLSSYARLRAGGAVRGSGDVIPGQPCDSGLVQKVSVFPPFGGRMPLSGPPFMTAQQVQLFHDWIAEGAREN